MARGVARRSGTRRYRGDGLILLHVRIDSRHILEYIYNLHKTGNCHCIVVLLERLFARLGVGRGRVGVGWSMYINVQNTQRKCTTRCL